MVVEADDMGPRRRARSAACGSAGNRLCSGPNGSERGDAERRRSSAANSKSPPIFPQHTELCQGLRCDCHEVRQGWGRGAPAGGRRSPVRSAGPGYPWGSRLSRMIDFSADLPLAQRQALGSAGLAALLTVARCGGEPSPKALAAIRGVRDHLLRIELDLDALPPITPERLAERGAGRGSRSPVARADPAGHDPGGPARRRTHPRAAPAAGANRRRPWRWIRRRCAPSPR